MSARLVDYKALTFDCYGTLIDWEAGIWDALQPLLAANCCGDVAREDLLTKFGLLESQYQADGPSLLYPDILYRVHKGLAKQFGLQTTPELDLAFGDSVSHWPAFPDSAEALRYLKSKYKLVILSNVNRAGFAASNRKLGVEFDAIYTAEDIGSYKPDPANFEYLIERLQADLGLKKTDVLHTAQSLFHDHLPAKKIDLANAWIDRQRLSEQGGWGATAVVGDLPEVDFQFFSMAEMVEAVETAST